jgi:hypothetical protein
MVEHALFASSDQQVWARKLLSEIGTIADGSVSFRAGSRDPPGECSPIGVSWNGE